MRKPNWKRQGLSKPITEKDRRLTREQKQFEEKVKSLPPELQDVARRNKWAIY